jgi:hypothetical protein
MHVLVFIHPGLDIVKRVKEFHWCTNMSPWELCKVNGKCSLVNVIKLISLFFHQQVVRRRGGTAPFILKLTSGYNLMVNLTYWPLQTRTVYCIFFFCCQTCVRTNKSYSLNLFNTRKCLKRGAVEGGGGELAGQIVWEILWKWAGMFCTEYEQERETGLVTSYVESAVCSRLLKGRVVVTGRRIRRRKQVLDDLEWKEDKLNWKRKR